jgi:hypothetical protein
MVFEAVEILMKANKAIPKKKIEFFMILCFKNYFVF